MKAWIISFNPTDKQAKLAEQRLNICDTCIHRKHKLTIPYCDACGCPISKKIFTDSINPCPKKKWKDVDEQSFGKIKTKETLI